MSLQFPSVSNLLSYWSTLGSLGVIWNASWEVCPAVFLCPCLLPCSRAEVVQRQAIIFKRTTNMCESQGSEKGLPLKKKRQPSDKWRNIEWHRDTGETSYEPMISLKPCRVSQNTLSLLDTKVCQGKVSKPSCGNSYVQTAKPDTWINEQAQSGSANTVALRLVPLRSRDLISAFPAKPAAGTNWKD